MIIKEMKTKIAEWIAGRPEGEIVTGRYLGTIGRKYISIIDIWDNTTLERMSIKDFYAQYISGHGGPMA